MMNSRTAPMSKFSRKYQKKLNKKCKLTQNDSFCQDMDILQQKYWGESSQQEKVQLTGKEKKIKKTTYKKPDIRKKINQIQAYEDALKQHRKTCTQFIDPFNNNIKLNIAQSQTINLLQDTRNKDSDRYITETLRSLGMKRVKIVCKGVANDHFQAAINYFKYRTIPMWMKNKFDELLQQKYEPKNREI